MAQSKERQQVKRAAPEMAARSSQPGGVRFDPGLQGHSTGLEAGGWSGGERPGCATRVGWVPRDWVKKKAEPNRSGKTRLWIGAGPIGRGPPRSRKGKG